MQKDKHGDPSGKHSSKRHNRPHVIRLSLLCLFAAVPALVQAQVPVFEITPQVSTIKFDVEASIAFKSTKIAQTGPETFEVDGDFTIRGVTKPEKLLLAVSGKGTGSGEIKGMMAFDRKDYGMNKGIPLVKIANRVEVTVELKVRRISGPPLDLKQ